MGLRSVCSEQRNPHRREPAPVRRGAGMAEFTEPGLAPRGTLRAPATASGKGSGEMNTWPGLYQTPTLQPAPAPGPPKQVWRRAYRRMRVRARLRTAGSAGSRQVARACRSKQFLVRTARHARRVALPAGVFARPGIGSQRRAAPVWRSSPPLCCPPLEESSGACTDDGSSVGFIHCPSFEPASIRVGCTSVWNAPFATRTTRNAV